MSYNKIAFVFPGQGAQSIGMGKELFDNFKEASDVFNKADEVLGRSISKICFEGPDEELKQTINTQPAILTASIAALEVFKAKSGMKADYVAGHSLGEYCALYESGALTLEDTFKLIQKRADSMNKVTGGSMSAVLGLADEKVAEVLKTVDNGYVDVANYNCPGQVVITGDEEPVQKASELLKEAGAKRVMPLAVSGAFHSKKMEAASLEFAEFLTEINVSDAKIPVVTNVDAKITNSGAELKEKMPKQICSSVYWTQSVQNMIENGVDTFVEIGPGKVLAGLIKKINAEAVVYNVFDKASLETCLEALKA